MSGQRQDRHGIDRHPGPRRAPDRLDLHRRAEAGRPVPALHDPRGFGINAKLVGVGPARPETGQLTAHFKDLPQVPFEEYDIHLFASDRGLMATPTHCTLYPSAPLFVPWNGRLARPDLRTVLQPRARARRSALPGPVRPFQPRLVAGTSNPLAGASPAST